MPALAAVLDGRLFEGVGQYGVHLFVRRIQSGSFSKFRKTFFPFATAQQRRDWLDPLLRGEMRSCFAMSEPDVASSDATNIETRIAIDGEHCVVNGRKSQKLFDWVVGAIFVAMMVASWAALYAMWQAGSGLPAVRA